jgi:hypothetical protein
MLIRATARAAARHFAVNHNCRHASNTVPLCLGRYFRSMHVVDRDLMRRTSKPFDEFDGFLAR